MIALVILANSIVGFALTILFYRIHHKWLMKMKREPIDDDHVKAMLFMSTLIGIAISAIVGIYCLVVYISSYDGFNPTDLAMAEDLRENYRDRPSYEQLIRENERLKHELADRHLLSRK